MERRHFVSTAAYALAAAAAAMAGCSQRQSGPGDLDAFMAKSKALTGYSDLDPQLGAAYFKIAGTSATDKQILTLWYGGIDGNTTVTWLGALAWRACGFTKPPSVCAAYGSWHQRP